MFRLRLRFRLQRLARAVRSSAFLPGLWNIGAPCSSKPEAQAKDVDVPPSLALQASTGREKRGLGSSQTRTMPRRCGIAHHAAATRFSALAPVAKRKATSCVAPAVRYTVRTSSSGCPSRRISARISYLYVKPGLKPYDT